MNQFAPILAARIPAAIAVGGEKTAFRFLEFFTAHIRHPHTRRACVHVAAYIEKA